MHFGNIRNNEENRLTYKAVGVGALLGLISFLGFSLSQGTLAGITLAVFTPLSFVVTAFFLALILLLVDFLVYHKVYYVEDIVGAVFVPIFLFFTGAVLQLLLITGVGNLLISIVMAIIGLFVGLRIAYELRGRLHMR